MKRRILALLVVIVLCMTMGLGTALAAAPEDEGIMPLSSLSISVGLPKMAGTTSSYTAKATLRALQTENLRVYVYLYDSTGKLLYSTSATKNGVTASVSFNRYLTPGTYKVVGKGYGATDSKTTSQTYKVS